MFRCACCQRLQAAGSVAILVPEDAYAGETFASIIADYDEDIEHVRWCEPCVKGTMVESHARNMDTFAERNTPNLEAILNRGREPDRGFQLDSRTAIYMGFVIAYAIGVLTGIFI
jgi:hypothetical protein